MRYVKARFIKESQAKTYRIYVTDSLKAIAENTARHYGGTVMNMRYADITSKPKPTESSDEVISRIRSKIQEIGG